MNKRKNLLLPALIAATILLTSWGYNGHTIIGWNMTFNLPAEMAEFVDWNTYLSQHSSDPDYRKGDDPTEGPKHYFNIDDYAEYQESGSVSQDLDSLIEEYGAYFVEEQGYLPWATIESYDSLVSKLRNRDWDLAKFYAADLSHYVADGFMPLHITGNYDGRATGNDGIHSRFESKMIDRHKDDIEVNVTEIEIIEGIEDYIFNYMYENIVYVDSIMAADDYGKSVDSNTSSYAYLDAMWAFSEEFTQKIFNEGTKAFSSLFYAAWLEAGEPLISTTSVEINDNKDDSDLGFFPNPVTKNATIKFNSNTNQPYELSLLNAKGSTLKKITENNPLQEKVELIWDFSVYEPGMYFLCLENSEKRITKKLMLGN